MINLYLVDARGVGLGMRQVHKIPEAGATLTLLGDGQFFPLEVLTTFTETVNKGRLFESTANWAVCRLKTRQAHA